MNILPFRIEEYRAKISGWFKQKTGQELNLDHPETFSEKIQWSKLYDSTPIKTRLADKYLVRDWVKEKIGEQYLIPLLGVYDSFENIDFNVLPERFVIKCNHGSSWNIIVKNKSQLDVANTKTKIDGWMKKDFAFHYGYELHYHNITPRIIIEGYIENLISEGALYDYKFWCFNGRVEYIQFISERDVITHQLKTAFYDREWVKQEFYYTYPPDDKVMEKPENLQEMINLAEKLSAGFNYVRVDLYRMDDGKIYFGEMTFTPTSGTFRWSDESINKYFGSLVKLPEFAYDIDTDVYYKERELRFYRSQLRYELDKSTESKLSTYGEQQTRVFNDIVGVHSKQLEQEISTIVDNQLSLHDIQLAQTISESIEKKLNTHEQQLIQQTENILSLHSKLLTGDFEKILTKETALIGKYQKAIQDSLSDIRKALLETFREISKLGENQQLLFEKKMQQECAALRKEIKFNHEKELKICRDFSQYGHYRRLYRWYKILRYITFGKLRRHYKRKVADLKHRIREIRSFI